MSANLGDLPAELFNAIAAGLSKDDVFALRLTCTRVERQLFARFVWRHFRSKCFMFTTESLKVLQGIAQSERLRDHLHEVYLTPIDFNIHLRKAATADRKAEQMPIHVRRVLDDYTWDQRDLQSLSTLPGGDRRFLSDAFRELTALRKICIVGDLYETPNQQTGCAGLNKVFRKTSWLRRIERGKKGYEFDLLDVSKAPEEHRKWRRHVLETTLLAIADSRTTSVRHLGLTIDFPWTSDFAQEPAMWPALTKCLQKLDTLAMSIDTTDRRRRRVLPKESDADTENFQALATAARQATRIVLSSLPPDDKMPGLGFGPVITLHDLQRLTRVDLSQVLIRSLELRTIVSGLTCAEHIALRHVSVFEGGWIPTIEALLELSHLDHLDLVGLSESSSISIDADRDPVSFWNPACYASMNKMPKNAFRRGPRMNLDTCMINSAQRRNRSRGYMLSGPQLSTLNATQPRVLGADFLEGALTDEVTRGSNAAWPDDPSTTEDEASTGTRPCQFPSALGNVQVKCMYRDSERFHREHLAELPERFPYWNTHCLAGEDIKLRLPRFIANYHLTALAGWNWSQYSLERPWPIETLHPPARPPEHAYVLRDKLSESPYPSTSFSGDNPYYEESYCHECGREFESHW